MSRFELSSPDAVAVPPFLDAATARAWLGRQPQTLPLQMQTILQSAIQALDASTLAPAVRIEILEALRPAVILAQTAAEARFARKPVPLPASDMQVLTVSLQLWHTVALAYLRSARLLPPAEAISAWHRGVLALRLEQYACFLAAYEVPANLLSLLSSALSMVESLGIQRIPVVDPEYPRPHESTIAGQVAWVFLLQAVDPYSLSASQLTVANRAFSRWRELAGFQNVADDHPKACAIPLARLLGQAALPEGAAQWLDIRQVVRKMHKRLEALAAGESPEALKLGRELSAAACIRLLQQLARLLQADASTTPGAAVAQVDLVFGAEKIYQALARHPLNSTAVDHKSREISHQRLALFGFDNLVSHPVAVQRSDVAGESWQMETDGTVWRAPDIGARLLAPCLVACRAADGQGDLRLGVLTGLKMAQDGALRARLDPYPPSVEAVWFETAASPKSQAGRLPAFVIEEQGSLSIVLPVAAGLRPGARLALQDSTLPHLTVGAVVERGSDFVRHAVTGK